MRLVYTSDLHGHTERYHQLRHIVYQAHPDVIILGGDLLPHHRDIKSSVQSQIQFIRHDFYHFLSDLPANIPVGIILGNDDWAAALLTLRTLAKRYFLYLIHDKPLTVNGVEILGYPYVPPTPFLAKDFEKLDKKNDPLPEHPETSYITRRNTVQSIATSSLFRQRSSIEEDLSGYNAHKQTIFVSHAPPVRTCLDRLHDGRAVGSHSVKNWIQRQQPLLSLHGHIHESPRVSGQFMDRIGSTISINPGQVENQLSAVVIHINTIIQAEHTVYGSMS
ncbi:metallophosphoesterase [bacterium]|nr:metallophosphoesterase [bacterium]